MYPSTPLKNTSCNHAYTIKYFRAFLILENGHQDYAKIVHFEKTSNDIKNQIVFVSFGQKEKNLNLYFDLDGWNGNKYRFMELSLYIVTCRVSHRVC